MFKIHEKKSSILLVVLGLLTMSFTFISFPASAQSVMLHLNTDRYLVQGQQAMADGKYEDAVELLSKAARQDLSSEHLVIVQNSVCASLFMLERHEEASGVCSDALESDKGYWKAYVNRGNAKRALGDIEGALADFCEANRLSPQHVGGKFTSQCKER